ncbi:MAG: GAF domain-containing protein [Actinomycetota bacterium]|nr:GAF domain-containing protein [Actinomycetota bacterium]
MEADGSHRVLSDVARLLVSESDLTRLLDSIADAVATLIPNDSLIIYEADAAIRELRAVLVRDPHEDEILAQGICRFGEGITGAAAERREAVLVNDADLDPRARHIEGTPVEEESLLTVPLVARGELKGMLNLYRHGRGNGFAETELELAERFAELAALAVDNAKIRERLEAEIVTDALTGVYNHRYFQERLAEELRRAARGRVPVSLALIDIDDFQRVNQQHGHLAGDHVLAGLGTLMRTESRPRDVVCRVGGEEFAVIMPVTGSADAVSLAEALRERIADAAFNGDPTKVTVSIGVAEGPSQAAGPQELMACANHALLTAKSAGRNRVSSYLEEEWSGVRAVPQHEARMVGHLKLLQTLSSKLNRLQDVRRIGETVLQELRNLLDYHNCRIHLLEGDGRTLVPVAFKGELTEYQGETYEHLVTMVGEGITGRVAETGEPIYAADAAQCEFAVLIPGTPVIDESILAVPMKFDNRPIGTIVLSKLGLNQFDADDLRLLESLASHAAVAFQNARLFEEERQSAETANALLRVSQALTRTRDPGRVTAEVVGSLSELFGGMSVSAWLQGPEGSFRCRATVGFSSADADRLRVMTFPAELGQRYLLSVEEPFFLPAEVVAEIPEKFHLNPAGQPTLVAPMRWEPDGLGVLVASGPPEATFSSRQFRLARGVADIASLALGNATRFADLEHAFLQTVEVLANALEAKDEYTHGHAREVAELALHVGEDMGMTDEELRTLELAGIFHDIGKIGVSSDIINKPSALTEEEMAVMQRHPEIGEQILAPVEFLQPVRPVVRSCHERWDGMGYPDALAGEDIPLAARIIFVCDAYHAMTSDRSYRKALPEEEALRRLRDAAGAQFDPNVVQVFLRLHAGGLRHHSNDAR